MPVYTIVYRSVPLFTGVMGDDIREFESVLANAQVVTDNGAVTGAMVFNEDWFIQLLEGDEAAVKERYERNLLDPRHKEVELLFEGETPERRFSNWSMAFIGDAAAIRARFEHSPLTKPTVLMHGDEVVDYMFALAGTDPTNSHA